MRSLLVYLSIFAVGVDAQQCTFCADSGTPNGSQINRVSTELTCADLNTNFAALSSLPDADSACKDHQLLAYQIGCCPTPPYDYCTVCPDGADFQTNNIVPQGTGQDFTCNEIQYRPETLVGIFEQGDCSDTFLQRGGHYCGCPGVQQKCFLCPDGSVPGNPDRGEGFVYNSNCRGIQYTFSLFTEEECSSVNTLFGFDASAFCLCPNYEQPEGDGECTLCGKGRVSDPNKIWTTATDTYERTCAQAEEFAQYFNRENTCRDSLASAREACCQGDTTAFYSVEGSGSGSGAVTAGVAMSFLSGGALVVKDLLF